MFALKWFTDQLCWKNAFFQVSDLPWIYVWHILLNGT